jgi:tRNA1(Val) A37 N6-methylase TrmN6
MNLGQVYTKRIVADFMVDLLDLPKNSNVVDPCFGRGVFIESLLAKKYTNITGVEIDKETYNTINFSDFSEVSLLNQDFFSYESDSVDGFILNPPYVRQEEIDDLKVLGVSKDAIALKCGDFNIYSKANLYIYFIARCITLLRDGGQLVAIFPNAWLNTPDGKGFLFQMETKGTVNNLIQVNGNPFVGNPLVDVMILKFTKGGKSNCKKETLIVDDKQLSLSEVQGHLEFSLEDCVPLSSIASIRRGVTTGFNKVFINPKIQETGNTVDILSTPKDVQGYSTKASILDKLLYIEENKPLSAEIKHYLDNAEKEILMEEKPKTLVRLIQEGKQWFNIRLPLASDIIFPYIIRDNVRFIYNEAKVIARDNFYTISSDIDTYLLVALLNNMYVYSQLEVCGKSYGKGLLKIQKYDVDSIVIPNPSRIDKALKKDLIKLAKSLIISGDVEVIADITNKLSGFYKIDNIKNIYCSQKKNRLNI